VIPASALVEEGSAAFVFVQPNPEEPVYAPQQVEIVRRGGNVVHVRVKDAGSQVMLYRTNGNGVFVDLTGSAGLDTKSIVPSLQDTKAKGIAVGDVDADGRLDVYIASDQADLLKKSGKVVFQDVSDSGRLHSTVNGMGVAFLDYDADGDLDLQVANLQSAPPVLQPGRHIVTAGAVELQAIRADLKPGGKR
jgi:hypothetical protein